MEAQPSVKTIDVQPYDEKQHYALLSSWWKAHQWTAIPPQCLPRTGLVADGIVAGFLYQSDSAIAWLEWVVADPTSDKARRARALDQLIQSLLLTAKLRGAQMVFTSVSHPGLLERYKSHGFVVGDTGMTNMVRSL